MTSNKIEYGLKTVAQFTVVAICFYRLLLCFSPTPELSVGETNNIWNALKMSQGQPLYTDPEKLPFEIFQYTPVSQYPIWLLSSMFDSDDANYLLKLYAAGRILTLAYNLISLFILYIILTRQYKVEGWVVWITLSILFSILTQHSYSIRPDSLALLFTILSFALFLKVIDNSTPLYIIVSGLFPALSFFTKQDFIFVIVPWGLWLLINYKWQLLVKWATTFIISLVLIYSLMYFMYGNMFFYSITKGVRTGFEIMAAYWVFDRFCAIYHISLLVAVFGLSYLTISIPKSNKAFFAALSAACFLGLAVFSSAKRGAWVNYYIPFLIWGFICFAVLSTHISTSKTAKTFFLLIITICAVVIPADQILKRTLVYTSPFLKYETGLTNYYKANKVVNFIADNLPNGKIYTTDNYIKNLLPHRTIFPNTEFYDVSSFDYSQYQKLPPYKKGLSIIVLSKTQSITDDRTLLKFGLNYKHFYLYQSLEGFNIYKYKL